MAQSGETEFAKYCKKASEGFADEIFGSGYDHTLIQVTTMTVAELNAEPAMSDTYFEAYDLRTVLSSQWGSCGATGLRDSRGGSGPATLLRGPLQQAQAVASFGCWPGLYQLFAFPCYGSRSSPQN